jgi:hypothetical protein
MPLVDGAALGALVGFASRLVLGAPPFAAQYLEAGGLAAALMARLLRPDGAATDAMVGGLLMVSQLARISEDNYRPIADSDILPQVWTDVVLG